jgi:hypothetical protein
VTDIAANLALPTVVIVRVGRPATSLFWYLSQHPGVCAAMKEIHASCAQRGDGASLRRVRGASSVWRQLHRLEAALNTSMAEPRWRDAGGRLPGVRCRVTARPGRSALVISVHAPAWQIAGDA